MILSRPRQRLDAAMKTIDLGGGRGGRGDSPARAPLFNPDGTPRADVVSRLLKAPRPPPRVAEE
jgi:hypothetical protein